MVGCEASSLPFMHLGMVVGHTMSRVSLWSGLLDWFSHRLSSWKAKSPSIGGRLTLLKSALGFIGTFSMSIFHVPLLVLRSL